MAKRKPKRGRRRRNPSGFWPWATEHWFISGFILLPTAIMMPVYLVQAWRQRQAPAFDWTKEKGVLTVDGMPRWG